MQNLLFRLLFAGFALLIVSCSKDDEQTDSDTSGLTDTQILALYEKVYGATNIYIEGDYVVVKSNGVPDHKSPYFDGTAWEAALYEANTDAGFKINPNRIGSQNYIFKIPKNPKEASSKSETSMGPMGVSINGVPLFNQYAAGRQALTSEIVSFDQYGGHPAQGSDYHYHLEPVWLTENQGSDALMGFLLDGFPVYGPMENGAEVTNDKLDVYHGHNTATADFPKGIYHYHITSAAPYINGNGFYGTPGTVSK